MVNLISKTKEILYRRKLRDVSQGGFTSMTVGPPGCGKTSHLLFEAHLFMNWYPQEIVFWRDSQMSACQFNRIGPNYKILIEDGCHARFRDLEHGAIIDMPYTSFNSLQDIIDMDTGKGLAAPQKLNVIYFKNDYTWIDEGKIQLKSSDNWSSCPCDTMSIEYVRKIVRKILS